MEGNKVHLVYKLEASVPQHLKRQTQTWLGGEPRRLAHKPSLLRKRSLYQWRTKASRRVFQIVRTTRDDEAVGGESEENARWALRTLEAVERNERRPGKSTSRTELYEETCSAVLLMVRMGQDDRYIQKGSTRQSTLFAKTSFRRAHSQDTSMLLCLAAFDEITHQRDEVVLTLLCQLTNESDILLIVHPE